MSPKPFHFKQFSIYQDQCAHKVGTDGVLLGAWVDVRDDDRNMLDIGTGSGVIALMLAQRSGLAAHIDAIDIGVEDAAEAKDNALRSPWAQKVAVHAIALQRFYPQKKYDLIVSNPPYFTRSLQPPGERRRDARHTAHLPFDELLASVSRLLAPAGRFAVILPAGEDRVFTGLAQASGLHAGRKCVVRSRAGKPPERVLLEFSASSSQPAKEHELVLHGEGSALSSAYITLTKDFYLHL